MAATLTNLVAALQVTLDATATKTTDLTVPVDVLANPKLLSTTFGTGANKADEIWHDRRVLALSTAEELDLAGSLTNAFGDTINLATVKAILIYNRTDETTTSPAHTATTAIIAIGGAAANTWDGPFSDSSDIVNLATGGIFIVTRPDATGMAVTAGTGDKLKIDNLDGANEALYDIVLIGESS